MPTTAVLTEADLFNSNPIIEQAEKALRCFEGNLLTRDLAERLLCMWGRRAELSDADWTAVLDRFGPAEDEAAVPTWEEIQNELDRFGDGTDQTVPTGEISIAETMAALRRLEQRLLATGNTEVYALGIREGARRAQVEADQQAYARGLVDAFSAVLDPEPLALRFTDDGSTAMTDLERAVEYRDWLRERVTQHAWIVRAVEGAPGTFLWTCACGGVAVQHRGEGGPDVLRAKLDAAHIPGPAGQSQD